MQDKKGSAKFTPLHVHKAHSISNVFCPMGPFLGFCMKNYSNDKGLTRNPLLPVKKNRDKTVPK